MIRYECRIGCLNAGIDPTPLASDDFAQLVAEHFLDASTGDIGLDIVFDVDFGPSLAAGQPATALDLHRGLMRLTGNATQRPISRLGLLLAASYWPVPAAFGVMFDRGFITFDDPNLGPFAAVPREGAAVFIDSIASYRNPTGTTPQAAVQELVFTAIHELGHIFNLWHVTTQFPTFMSTSLVDQPFGMSAFRFAPVHRQWLSRCSVDDHVRPGESHFLDQGASFNVKPIARRRRRDPRLALSIAVHPKECWPFEPIHLDMRVVLRGGKARRIEIPAIMDPAHEDFRLYIENPLGERRLYRSAIHCCPPLKKLHITCRNPYRRDIPIFCDLEGYTFRMPGRYRVSVEVDVGQRYRLRSNTVDVKILPTTQRVSGAMHRLRKLDAPTLRNALLFGKDGAAENAHERLDAIVKGWRPPYSERQSAVLYLAARTLLANGRTEQALLSLRALQGDRSLGRHRMIRVRELLSSLDK